VADNLKIGKRVSLYSTLLWWREFPGWISAKCNKYWNQVEDQVADVGQDGCILDQAPFSL
jgi:hypothetical protein